MRRPQVELVTCSACAGSGSVPSDSTGAVMRMEREERGLTRGAVAPHFMRPDGRSYSETYIVDLERDSRAWSAVMIESYRRAIEDAVAAKLEEVNA